MKLYDNDAYRDEFMEAVYNLLSDDSSNDRANQVIDLFDAAPAVEAEPAPSNDPLTLEELREMDGEPVWVEDLLIPKCSCYHFVQKIGCHILLMEPRYYPAEDVMIPHYCANDENQGYQNTWLAYRRKPEV